MISNPTGEGKPQAKACDYRFFSKESLNLGRTFFERQTEKTPDMGKEI